MRMRHSILFSLIGLVTVTQAIGQEYEQFRQKSGDAPFEAKPVSWNFQTGTLVLERADGTTLDVPAAELHATDMRLIERLLKKQLLAGKKGESILGPSTKPAKNGTTGKIESTGNFDLIHGVKWFDNESDAKLAALGRDGSQDDRPMIWFRVLGDMTGFM